MANKQQGKLSFMNKYDNNKTEHSELLEQKTIYSRNIKIAYTLSLLSLGLITVTIIKQVDNFKEPLDISLKQELLKLQIEKSLEKDRKDAYCQ
jgi:hypothetical protein